MAERHIYLVRHGQYFFEDDSSDELGGGLTNIGREQAALVAQALGYLPLTAIYHSTMRRARETAEIVGEWFPNLNLLGRDELWEVMPCVPPHMAEDFYERRPKYSPEMVEKNLARAEQAYKTFFAPAPHSGEDLHEALVCHGNLLRYFVCRVLDAPCESFVRLQIYNCGYSHLKVDEAGEVQLVRHNDVGHLPKEMRTEM